MKQTLIVLVLLFSNAFTKYTIFKYDKSALPETHNLDVLHQDLEHVYTAELDSETIIHETSPPNSLRSKQIFMDAHKFSGILKARTKRSVNSDYYEEYHTLDKIYEKYDELLANVQLDSDLTFSKKIQCVQSNIIKSRNRGDFCHIFC